MSSSNIFLFPFPLSSGTLVIHILGCLELFYSWLLFFPFLKTFFLHVSFWIVFITMPSCSRTFLLPYLICHKSHSVYFLPQTLQFSTLKSQFGSFVYLHVSSILKIWNRVIKAVLESFSANSNICVSSGSVAIDWLFFSLWLMFSGFLVCLIIFSGCQTLWFWDIFVFL